MKYQVYEIDFIKENKDGSTLNAKCFFREFGPSVITENGYTFYEKTDSGSRMVAYYLRGRDRREVFLAALRRQIKTPLHRVKYFAYCLLFW